jgi:hypothetical protein
VVVVAEIFSAEVGALAAVSVGEDVAALEAGYGGGFDVGLDVVHGWAPSPGGFAVKS